MDPIAKQISRVSEKLSRFLKDFKSLQKENERLRQELDKKTRSNNALEEKCAQLERQIGILQASPSMTGQTGKDLEKLIEQYIREIDKCIARANE